MADSGTFTPEVIARRLAMAQQLLGDPKQPIRHWAEGLNELAKGAVGGYMFNKAESDQKAGEANSRDFMAQLLMGGGGASPAAAPTSVTPPMGGGVADKIINVESGGDPNARNPMSSASGAGQFINSTWLDTIKKANPAIAAGKSDEELLALRADPNLSKEMTGAYAASNGQHLQSNGIQPTPGNTYLAHFAGPAGATAILKADPQAPIASIIGPKAMAANPFLANMTAGDVRAWADKKMGQPQQPSTQGAVAQALTQPPQGAGTAPVAAPAVANPMASRIAEALRSNDPFIARAAQQMAGPLIAKQFTPPEYQKLNDDQLFEKHTGKTLSAGTGYRPIVDPAERSKFGIPENDKRPYQIGPGNKLINPPAETRLNIDQRAEGTYDTTMNKHFADANIAMIKGSTDARSKIAMVDQMSNLLADPGVYQGTAGEKILQLKRAAKSMGFDVGDLGGAEAANAISNMFALELRNPSGGAGMPGAMSDKDREFLQAIPPGLGKTPEGNKQMADYLRKTAQRSIDVDRFRQKYIRQHKRLDENFYTELADWSDAHPLFAEAKGAVPAGPATGNNVDDLLKKYGPK